MSTHNIPFLNIKRKSSYIIPNLQLWDLFQGTQDRVRNIRGKRAISVRAIEALQYFFSRFPSFAFVFQWPVSIILRKNEMQQQSVRLLPAVAVNLRFSDMLFFQENYEDKWWTVSISLVTTLKQYWLRTTLNFWGKLPMLLRKPYSAKVSCHYHRNWTFQPSWYTAFKWPFEVAPTLRPHFEVKEMFLIQTENDLHTKIYKGTKFCQEWVMVLALCTSSDDTLYSRTSVARTPFGPWKLVRDRGSSS